MNFFHFNVLVFVFKDKVVLFFFFCLLLLHVVMFVTECLLISNKLFVKVMKLEVYASFGCHHLHFFILVFV